MYTARHHGVDASLGRLTERRGEGKRKIHGGGRARGHSSHAGQEEDVGERATMKKVVRPAVGDVVCRSTSHKVFLASLS